MLPGLAPPPATVQDLTVVAAELDTLNATVVFDIAARRARVEAAMTFAVGSEAAAAFDLRQRVDSAVLDGEPLRRADLAAADLGAGRQAAMRVIRRPLGPGVLHRLELAYELRTPAVEGAVGVGWGPGRVGFDLWCSDLAPGRYIEQWLPVSLCQDRFTLTLDVELRGATEPHRVIANGEVTPSTDEHWQVAWPGHFTSLSPLLRIGPVSGLRQASAGNALVTADAAIATPVHELAERVAGWLEDDERAFGPFVHHSPFVAHVWEASRGMEYDGATTGSEGSLEHEVFHSWFGRGVKPASASDGWIDEALATWWTSDHPDHPRQIASPLALDGDPVVLAPTSPWSRHTPREAYRTGYLLMAGVAHLAGGADRLAAALAGFYQSEAGGFVSTAALQRHLEEELGVDLAPWWDRYVRGIS